MFPRRFPVSILWEFNLIPADIPAGMGFSTEMKEVGWEKKQKKLQNKIKSETKKLGQIGEDFFFLLFFGSLERTVVFGYLSLSLSFLPVCVSVSLSRSVFTEIILSYLPELWPRWPRG